MSRRTRIQKFSINDATAPLTLEDLRWLVRASSSLSGETVLEVQGARHQTPVYRDPASITVAGRADDDDEDSE